MIKLPIVKNCPTCTASVGQIELPINLIQEITGAVKDPLEWAIILHGTKSDDWLNVRVERFSIPPQKREKTTVDIEEHPIEEDVVGVIHSHHGMGAFFSQTDVDTLNPNYPVSIVVAQYEKDPKSFKHPQHLFSERVFGWNFMAVGKITLPCGSLGEIRYDLVPYDEEDGARIEGWNYELAGMKVPLDSLVDGKILQNHCPVSEVEVRDGFVEVRKAPCGIQGKPVEAVGFWGSLEQLRGDLEIYKPKVETVTYYGGSFGKNFIESPFRGLNPEGGKGYTPVQKGKQKKQKQASLLVEIENDNINSEKLLNHLIRLAQRVNKANYAGISLPTTRDYDIKRVDQTIKTLLNNEVLLRFSDIGHELRHWFAILLEDDIVDPWMTTLQFNPDLLIKLLKEESTLNLIDEGLRELFSLN